MFIDTHCHFDFSPFIDDIDFSIKKAQEKGIKNIIVPTVSCKQFDSVLDLSKQHKMLLPALGLHPIYSHNMEDMDKLQQKLQQYHCDLVAIGEIGLDKQVITPDFSTQLSFFRQQLLLAKQYDLPVILHSRKTHELILQELKRANLPCCGVIHGFSGSYEQAMQFVKQGYYIGVGGVISYQRANKTRDAIRRLPLNALLLETDAPDMPLYTMQGKPNRPENIIKIFDELTKIRTEAPSEIKETIWINTLTLFNTIHRINY